MILLSSVVLAAPIAIQVPEVDPDLEPTTHAAVIRVLFDQLDTPSDDVFPSSSPWVTCSASDTAIHVTVDVHSDAWAELPPTATCALPDETLVVDLVRTDMADSWGSLDLQRGLTVAPSGLSVRALPANLQLQERRGRARLGSRRWKGVQCAVWQQEDGPLSLRVESEGVSPTGSGHCELRTTDGERLLVPVHIRG